MLEYRYHCDSMGVKRTVCSYVEKAYRVEEHEMFRPDVSFISSARLRPPSHTGPYSGAPDIAVEVISSDRADRLRHKIRKCLQNGSAVVLLVYPEDREVTVHTPSGVRELSGDDVLALSEVLPGFSVRIS